MISVNIQGTAPYYKENKRVVGTIKDICKSRTINDGYFKRPKMYFYQKVTGI